MSKVFIQENALEYIVCEMATIFSRSQCGKENLCLSTLFSYLAGISKCTYDMAYVLYILHSYLFNQAFGGLFT